MADISLSHSEVGEHHATADSHKGTFEGELKCDWCIRVRCRLGGVKHLKRASAIAQMESEIDTLFTRLTSTMEALEIDRILQRFIEPSSEINGDTDTLYWLIGLRTIPSSEKAVVNQILREWKNKLPTDFKSQDPSLGNTVQAKLLPRRVLSKQILLPAPDEELNKDVRRAGDTFRKISGSSPSSIRRQFLHHAMGSDGAPKKLGKQPVKLRPAKQVLNRLRHNPTNDLNDYVVGYIDRQAGILEKPVSEWQDFEPEDHIAYFKKVSDDCIVWDKVKKIDQLFAS